MITRTALARRGHSALRSHAKPCSSRCLATAASGSFAYETGDAGGVKIASRDLPGPTTHLAVVAKAGSRYQPFPGFSEGLEKFSFKVSRAQTVLSIVQPDVRLGLIYSGADAIGLYQ